MSDWQPIETAPAGISFLGWSEKGGGVGECCLYYGRGMTVVAAALLTKAAVSSLYFEPTHWMPLPDPPSLPERPVKEQNVGIAGQ